MNVEEMRNEFEIGYNAIASMSSPGLDSYEVSVFSTKAQLELVKDYYNPDGNKYNDGFENSEKRRADLKELVIDYKTTIKLPKVSNISQLSQFFAVPPDMYLPVYESADYESPACDVDRNVNVYAKTHDEYNIQISNPFKNPDRYTIWRLNMTKHNGVDVVELLSPIPIGRYNLRYIKYPSPIIIEDLTVAFPGQDLSIDGKTEKTECELYEGIHREIVDRAVEIALAQYKPSGLQVQAQIDQRNE